ncbi:SMP-30/gluconolactonase/LRE family protein [Rhodococcus opacus]|nr:SMP-30/gluconolactonase/LRE family protein [Rhodococcus opacus]
MRAVDGVHVLAAGIGFTEGPVAWGDDAVVVTSMTRGLLYRVDLGTGETHLLAEPGGGPNGLAVATDGALVVAQSGGHVMPTRSEVPVQASIQHVLDGEVSTLTMDVNSPSDCVIGTDGRFWFTDPADHALDTPTRNGDVRVLDLTSGTVSTVLSGLSFPNGIAFGADPSELYVAETSARCIRRYRVNGDHVTADGWVAEMPTGHPDGIALDAAGWLWVAGSTGANLVAFDPDGHMAHEITFEAGHLVTSLCFAGPDLSTMIITSPKGGTVYSVPALHPGLPLPVRRNAPVPNNAP